jgi:hypothetical protein
MLLLLCSYAIVASHFHDLEDIAGIKKGFRLLASFWQQLIYFEIRMTPIGKFAVPLAEGTVNL